MKIGIISINMYSKGLNFACPLHTYAFQQFLLENGIDSTVIDYKPVYYDNFDLKHPAEYFLEKYRKYSQKKVSAEEESAKQEKLALYWKRYEEYQAIYREREIRYEKFQKFIEQNYIKTEICYDSDLLEVLDPGFDCYICATDVIWKNEPGFGFDRGFFLASKAMENKWKIAYAASRGARIADTPEEKEQFFCYLDDFDRISVRESSLKEYIEENSEKEATVVLDPVLLHGKEFYEKLAVKPQEEHYIFLYYVMEKASDTIRQAVRFARKYKFKIVEMTERASEKGRLGKFTDIEKIYRYDVGIEEWLGYIQNADYVFTNSFHACCFSILFEKEFFAGSRYGDKVTNILEITGLQKRRINIETDLRSKKPEPIDYNIVRTLLEQKRKESAEFILSAIHKAEEGKRDERDYDTRKKTVSYKILYNSHAKGEELTHRYGPEARVERLASKSLEFHPDGEAAKNDGTAVLMKNGFVYPGYHFKGWNIRLKIDNRYFWYLEDGSLSLKDAYSEKRELPIKVFAEGDRVPYIPVNRISVMVAEAVWEKNKKINTKDSFWKNVKGLFAKV